MTCLNQKDIYDTWMYEKSDNIQVATSYGEKYGKSILKVIEESDDDLKETLIELYKVYCLTLIKENIGFFIKENLINKNHMKK